jgi:aconitase A
MAEMLVAKLLHSHLVDGLLVQGDEHRYLKSMCARYGLVYSPPGNGICHYLHLERFARPGLVLVGADSHTTMAGAVSMYAVGAGGLEVALCLAGQPFSIPAPRVVGVELRGRLSPWVQGKDVVLELLRRRACGVALAASSSSSGRACQH